MSQMDAYKIIKKLGSGGGGNVYLAQHLRLDKKVVLKIDKRKINTSQDLLRREVDILKELSHPYIPRVYDFFIEDENVCTAMDYIEGESLDKALKRGERFPQAQVIKWAVQLLDALTYLHNPVHGDPPKGYVHSDIKPANLMRTPQGDICLIDFNVAGALGEENSIGFSAGYASPEHYGLDFSLRYEEEAELSADSKAGQDEGPADEEETVSVEDLVTVTLAGKSSEISVTPDSSGISGHSPGYYNSAGPSQRRKIIPDIRSDVYSAGAALYHLLSGKRPAKHAKEVIPLSEKEFNPQIVKIISKAMNPNRDLRYQTAEEMKEAFQKLRENDPRMRRWRRNRRIAYVLFPAFFAAGSLLAFTGLKRMQMMENWLKRTEYSQAALEKGDIEEAIGDALSVLEDSRSQWMPEHVPGIQQVLTEALGVYDLSDSYKMYKTVDLPAAPHYLAISPEGKTAAALCGQTVVICDTNSGEVLAELPVGKAPISQIKYMDKDSIIYGGKGGITAYDIKAGRELWKGEAAAVIHVSADGKRAAGVGEGETHAAIYDTATGEIVHRVDFGGRSQSIGIKDNLFALNHDGSMLGVSFSDGSLEVFCPDQPEKNLIIFRNDSGYVHFEGGFSGKYFAFLAADGEKSTFGAIDTEKGEEAGGFRSETAFGVQADENGVYVQSENILVKIDPVTGGQTPVVTMDEEILRFAVNGTDAVAASKQEISFFDKDARQTACYKKEYQSDLVCLAGGTSVVGSMDRPVLRIMKYEENPETERFTYDSGYEHKEARVSSDGSTVMLFSYRHFRVYDQKGKMIREVILPDPDHILDQQFIRENGESYLEVTYDNGKADVYSAKDGSLLWEEKKERPAADLDEEFLIGHLRIESPLHGTPVVYDAETGKELARLKEDTYLAYAEKAGDYIVAQYITADGYRFGQLLNMDCEVLADLPYLCDVAGENLIFDYPSGSIRESKIYDAEELKGLARDKIRKEPSFFDNSTQSKTPELLPILSI